MKYIFAIFLAGILHVLAERPGQAQDEDPGSRLVTFKDHIKPILRQHCLKCHGDDEQEAGINLQDYSALMQGGSSGRIVIPGRASQSILLRAISNPNADARMPPNSPPLSDEKVATIRKWIEQGLRESATSRSLATSRDLAFEPSASAGHKPDAPVMPELVPEFKNSPVYRPLPILALDSSRWSPLAAVAGQEHVRLIHTETQAELARIAFPEGIPNVVRFSRDGSVLMVAGGRPVELGLVVLFDVRTGKRLAEIGDETDAVLAADLSPDQTLVALGGSGRVAKVFSTTNGKQQFKLTKHTDWITSIAFSADGSKLATGDRAGGIHLWDTKSGGILLNFAEHKSAVRALDWRSDGKLLASAGEDGKVVWWDVTDGFPAINKANAHPPEREPGSYGKISNGVLSCRFSLDGHLVTTGRDRTVRVWDASGSQTNAFTLPTAIPVCSGFTHDGRLVISGDSDGHVRFWKTK